jgi:hypothetical protein
MYFKIVTIWTILLLGAGLATETQSEIRATQDITAIIGKDDNSLKGLNILMDDFMLNEWKPAQKIFHNFKGISNGNGHYVIPSVSISINTI